MSVIKLWSVEGNRQMLDGGAMFGNAPRAVWEKWIQPDERGRIPLACRALLAEIDGKKVLCETGIGAFFEPKMADRFGVQNSDRHMLLENLNAVGVSADEIDFVILSHLHFDHAGGLLPSFTQQEAGDESLVFKKAQFVVGKEAFERAKNPHFRDRASFIPGLVEKLEASGRLILIEEGAPNPSLPSAIEFVWTHGHTPGQMHTLIKGDQSQIFYAGDLIPGRAWVHLPITMGYDRFPEQLIDEKQKLYERIAGEQTYVFFTHDHEVSCSKVTQSEKYRFVPVDNHDELKAFEI